MPHSAQQLVAINASCKPAACHKAHLHGCNPAALQRNAAALISACLESSDSAIQAAIEARVVSLQP